MDRTSLTFSSIIFLAQLICSLVPFNTIFLSVLTPADCSLSTSTLQPDTSWMSLMLLPCRPMILPTVDTGTYMVTLSRRGWLAMVWWIRI